MDQPKTSYRRRLVHHHENKGNYFITFNLQGAIPKVKRELGLRRLAEQRDHGQDRRWFAALETFLHEVKGPTWLGIAEVANVVRSELHQWDGIMYDLHCYTIMPNHVHLLFAPRVQMSDGRPLTIPTIMHAIKRRSALSANRLLGRTGTFWQHESFDHWVRSPASFNKIVQYILDNPVKAGLVSEWERWPWTYLRRAGRDLGDSPPTYTQLCREHNRECGATSKVALVEATQTPFQKNVVTQSYTVDKHPNPLDEHAAK
jgi:putative transposase